MQEVLDQHNRYRYTRCALFELNTDIEAMRTQTSDVMEEPGEFSEKYFHVFFPGLVLTPRKLGTTRLWTLTPTFRITKSM